MYHPITKTFADAAHQSATRAVSRWRAANPRLSVATLTSPAEQALLVRLWTYTAQATSGSQAANGMGLAFGWSFPWSAVSEGH